VQDKVFVIRTTKYMERDLIAQTYSAVYGKKSYLVRGGQRSKKRFGGGTLETGNLIAIEFKISKQTERMGTLEEAKVIKGYEKIRTDYDKINLSFYFFKLVDRIDWSEDEFERVYSLLGNTQSTLEVSDKLETIKFIFNLKLLYLQGLLPINETTKAWLHLKIEDSPTIDTSDPNYRHYLKICEHLIKELVTTLHG